MKSNLDRWRLATDHLPSPSLFIDFSYYSLVCSALQRRVWTGPDHMKLFPNLYTVLCAEPGIGKGVIIKEVYDFLSFFKKEKKQELENLTDDQKAMASLQSKGERRGNTEEQKEKKARIHREETIIPIAADTTTSEALIQDLADTYDIVKYLDKDGKKQIYSHNSLCFCLEELSSLFNLMDDKVPKLLLKTYDCGPVEKKTKHSGNDYIQRCCLNFIAGTTPSFMQEIMSGNVVNDGFASRTFFLFEYANRFRPLRKLELTQEQQIAKLELRIHIFKLTKVFGACTFTEEAWSYIENWWKRFFEGLDRPNTSIKLKGYYSRKNIHIQKMAMAIHFGESIDSMIITLDSVIKAFQLLERAERSMHHALCMGDSNPLAKAAKKVISHMKGNKNGVTFEDLLFELYGDVRDEELREVMKYLDSTDQVSLNTKGQITYYSIKTIK